MLLSYLATQFSTSFFSTLLGSLYNLIIYELILFDNSELLDTQSILLFQNYLQFYIISEIVMITSAHGFHTIQT